MKSWHLKAMRGPRRPARRDDRDMPQPGPREVLVRVHACSLNYREIGILKLGRYPLPITPGVVALCDGAGEVVALGEGASRVKTGERVIASIFPHWIDGPFGTDRAAQLGGSLDGMLTEYAVLPEEALVPVPAHLDYQEAAALPCAAATAWNALDGGLALKPGDDVLTLGSGGVSLLALQLAKAAGARVIATTSSDDKAERLRALGADEVVNYRALPEWSTEVRRLTQGQGVQHVVEVGGGATLPQSLKSVAIGGDVGFVGSVAAGSLHHRCERGVHIRRGVARHRGRQPGAVAACGAHRRAARSEAGDRPRLRLRRGAHGAGLVCRGQGIRQDRDRGSSMNATAQNILVRSGRARWLGTLAQGEGAAQHRQRRAARSPLCLRHPLCAGGRHEPRGADRVAHAGCYSMALAYLLAQAGASPRQIAPTASLTLQMSAEGPDVTGIHLRVEAIVDGIDTSAFERIAPSAKETCLVSHLLKTAMSLET